MSEYFEDKEPTIVVGGAALTEGHRIASELLLANDFMTKHTVRDPESGIVGLNPENPITREVAITNVGHIATVVNIDSGFVKDATLFSKPEIEALLPLLEVMSADDKPEA